MSATDTAPAAATTTPRRYTRPEVLSPAGDWECVRAAVENGADAVYFGLERFNARMRAKNFTQADLPALMEFLHRRGVRGYVTFNTLVFTNELPDAEQFLRAIISAGVDAAIVQDIGICRLIRRLSPDFPIHGSTQMTVTNTAGVNFARDLDAQLIVLARENSIAEIEKIQAAQAVSGQPPLPLEVFVHGALCVAYSGQCLTSESLGGRSANRGECAQACRMPYDLYSDGEKVDLGDRRYLLSPQDLAGLDVLADLVRAGVSSLKIEGRLKAPEYVASITRIYRQTLDKVMAQLNSPIDASGSDGGAVPPPRSETPATPTDRYELQMAFSRGQYTGWFRGIHNQELAHGRFGTKRGVFLGEVTRVSDEAVTLRPQAPLKPGDGIVFDAGNPEVREQGGRIYQVDTRDGQATLRFGHGDIDFRRVRTGQLLWKTNDPALDKQVRQTFEGEKIRFQRPLHFEAHGRAGQPLTLIATDDEGHSAKLDSQLPLEPAQNQPLTTEKLTDQLGRLGGTPFKLGRLENHLEGAAMLPVSELNRLRRDLATEVERLRALPKRWTLTPPSSGLSTLSSQLSTNSPTAAAPELILVVRTLAQLDAALTCPGVTTLYCEFENPKNYREAVTRFRTWQSLHSSPLTIPSSIWVAPPRVTKPGEEWILNQVRSCEADGYLVRNHDHLAFFAADRKRGDFSLNVANPLTAEYFISRYGLERVTASYDLNIVQLESLLAAAPAPWFDLTIHQHMPMFHMEHCVFCAFLSSGKDYHDCGRPCEKHEVRLKDRTGAEFPLKADAGCRNTVYNNRAQTGAEYLDRLLALGARSFRVEFVNESADEVTRTITQYQRLLRREISGADLWRELKLLNQLGVTRGQMETTPRFINKKQ
ncbi:peptidase U32 [Nibricoccus aquaticus]|uniref:Peptidase U32 n=1 Tax=Nibricoccus aquaticus TaxID=2576891 RepID=A0A290QFY0_9BACT|nr:U32 family peptidase [Nibricoccus aquaticus]ATC64248.1 peptidase U32 [Nibricoccus aquaticus]